MRKKIYSISISLIVLAFGIQLMAIPNLQNVFGKTNVKPSFTDDFYTPEIHFFAFNRARLKDDKRLQQRGVDAIENISSAVKTIPGVDCKTIIEPVRSIEEYRENPEDPIVTQKSIFQNH